MLAGHNRPEWHQYKALAVQIHNLRTFEVRSHPRVALSACIIVDGNYFPIEVSFCFVSSSLLFKTLFFVFVLNCSPSSYNYTVRVQVCLHLQITSVVLNLVLDKSTFYGNLFFGNTHSGQNFLVFLFNKTKFRSHSKIIDHTQEKPDNISLYRNIRFEMHWFTLNYKTSANISSKTYRIF